MAQRICWPTLTRSAGEEMRLTDMQSMGSRALMPHPTSQKAPKDSMWVTAQGRMSPGSRVSRYSSRHICWALARDRRQKGRPSASSSRLSITKQVARPTLVSTAMSRTAPVSAPSAQAAKGITPRTPPRSNRSWRWVSKARAVACRISPLAMAARSSAMLRREASR